MVLVVKNLSANKGDLRDWGSILGSGRPSGGEHGKLLQFSCLENPMDRGRRLVDYSPRGQKQSDTTEVTIHACNAL